MKRRKNLNKYASNTFDPQKLLDDVHTKRKDFKKLRDATAFGSMLTTFGPNYSDYNMTGVTEKDEVINCE